MAWLSYKGLDLITDNDSIEVLSGGDRLYFKRFTNEVAGLIGSAREDWLIRQAVVKAEEHLDGGIMDGNELEPWS